MFRVSCVANAVAVSLSHVLHQLLFDVHISGYQCNGSMTTENMHDGGPDSMPPTSLCSPSAAVEQQVRELAKKINALEEQRDTLERRLAAQPGPAPTAGADESTPQGTAGLPLQDQLLLKASLALGSHPFLSLGFVQAWAAALFLLVCWRKSS